MFNKKFPVCRSSGFLLALRFCYWWPLPSYLLLLPVSYVASAGGYKYSNLSKANEVNFRSCVKTNEGTARKFEMATKATVKHT